MTYTFNEIDLKTLTQWKTSHNQTTQITRTPSDHDQSAAMESFLKALTDETPQITAHTDSDKKEFPALTIGENITFNAIPQGNIFSQFLKALSSVTSVSVIDDLPQLSTKTTDNLSRIEVPTLLKLYIANQCPHCPSVLAILLSLATTSPLLRLQIIDGTLFPEEASKENVLAAPCLILDDDFRWTGSVTAEEITDMIVNRDPSALSTASLRMILEDGKADWIAQQMTDGNQIFPGFIGLVIHPIWSVRLGAMVVLEEMMETAPMLVLTTAPVLLTHFKDVDVPTQGDILYALGEIGDESVKQTILELMEELRNPDLKEAAQEAIESIESRNMPI